jgi:hypothetical protein
MKIMRECAFVYEAPTVPFSNDAYGAQAILKCQTHNCLQILNAHTCLIGQLEKLEARIAELERRGEHHAVQPV